MCLDKIKLEHVVENDQQQGSEIKRTKKETPKREFVQRNGNQCYRVSIERELSNTFSLSFSRHSFRHAIQQYFHCDKNQKNTSLSF